MIPFPYQLEAVEFLIDRPMPSKSALLALEPGLGKSACAILASKKLNATRMIVVCPAGLRHNWKREFDLWWPERNIQIIEKSTDTIGLKTEVLIVSYDLIGRGFMPGCPNDLLRRIMHYKYDVGVYDEAHFLKEKASLRTKAILLKDSLASRCQYKFFLTGTPVLNRPIELYVLMKACIPVAIKPYDTYKAFAERFCGGHMGRFDYWDRGATNIEDLAERLEMSGFMLRKEKKDVLPDLPERFLQLVTLDIDDSAKPLVKKEFDLNEKYRAKGQLPPMEEMSKIRHELAIAKIPAVVEYIRLTLESKEKVVVFAHHTKVIDELMSRLSEFGRVVIDGRVSMKAREEVVKKFQTDPEIRIFIGQIQAAGTGITLTASDYVIFAEMSFVPGEINQCIDRCHRIGSKNNVTAQFCVASGTMEEIIIKQLVDKTLVINQLVK